VLKYNGLDWLAMTASLLAFYLIGNKNRLGFVSFMLANTLWIYLGIFRMESFGISIGNVFFLIMNFRGFQKWTKIKE
jgi:hypothetical protein